MSAVLLAVFDDYLVAEHVRVALVRDGFPTDRIELTASCEPGRAGLGPAISRHDKLVQYFAVLFIRADQRHHPQQLAERVEKGAATITVHPRGAAENARALAIFENAGAVQVLCNDLTNQMPRTVARCLSMKPPTFRMTDIGRRRGATFAALITLIALASLAAAFSGCAVGRESSWRLTGNSMMR